MAIKKHSTAKKKAEAKPNGRPPMFRTPQEMQKKIDLYFETMVGKFPLKDRDGSQVYDKTGNPVLEECPPTVSGLALYLGFADRISLYDYKMKTNFADTVKKAIARVEAYAEKSIMTRDKPTGAIFWLKNHGWCAEEKRDIKVTAPTIVDDIPKE